VYDFQGGGFFMCIYASIMRFATRSVSFSPAMHTKPFNSISAFSTIPILVNVSFTIITPINIIHLTSS
ncbi:hypothetical protein, partial [Parageobacillus thermoglucosidasius]|uniref:hypothetical protein n=1 Tax=Parageobacillus thermoglucosidasius TaxID=1426 RepID=UPI0030C6FB8E